MRTVKDLMKRGVDEGVFPGAALLVAREGSILFLEAFGRARLLPERPMTTDTVFDLASLTKPLATAVSVMLLVQQGRVDLDQPLGTTVAEFSDTDKKDISIRQLLAHTSGLPDYQPYYEKLRVLPQKDRKRALEHLLLSEPRIHEPVTVCLYSDLGFMILQWVFETVTNHFLDRFVKTSVYGPLGIGDLFFNPLGEGPNQDRRVYAATEDCPWRGKILDGEVHDDNAYALGGVAGHAGLFGTAQAVFGLLQELLNAYSGKPNAGLFHRDVVKVFFQRQSDVGSWAMGFDTPTRPDSSSGRYFSDHSVGHLGFTGTSFWMDLEKGVIVILLTNRVHLGRTNEKIKAFRPLLHDRVMETMLKPQG
ncbi:MAG: serine hydrolase [Deltaproteobacteria bacterium]|nr:serine hydrolase [Deltaproteobacteria bacterium]